jgi:type I restriction enzyme S subunit
MSKSAHLADLLLDTKDGDWGTANPTEEHSDHYVIRGADFPEVRRQIITSVPYRYLPDRSVWRRVLQANDILLETAGGTRDRPTGRSLLVTEGLLKKFNVPVTGSSFTRFLRADPTKVDARFLFWYLQYLYMAGETFHLPDMRVQQRIADVLGALDDKITVNGRAIALYDQLCATRIRAVAQVGKRAPLGELMKLHYGKALPAADRKPGAVAVYGSGGIVGRHDTPLVDNSGVIVGRKGTVGAVYWADGPHYPIDTTYYIEPIADVSAEVIYYLLKSSKLADLNSDSAVPGLNRNEAYSQCMHVPCASESHDLAVDLRRAFSWMRSARSESLALAHTRDELLPLLMSGKVGVKDAEAVVGDVV